MKSNLKCNLEPFWGWFVDIEACEQKQHHIVPVHIDRPTVTHNFNNVKVQQFKQTVTAQQFKQTVTAQQCKPTVNISRYIMSGLSHIISTGLQVGIMIYIVLWADATEE
jgi:hypothetical protein